MRRSRRRAVLSLSELMVGGPLEVGELLNADDRLSESTSARCTAILEAYGAKTDGLTMEFEVATNCGGAGAAQRRRPDPPGQRDTGDLHQGDAGPRRWPPGKYVLRAILSADGASVKTLTRGFRNRARRKCC